MRTSTKQALLAAALGLCCTFTLGCPPQEPASDEPPAEEPATEEAGTEEPVAAESESECTDAAAHVGECEPDAMRKGGKSPRFRDEADDGDDPFHPGCHWGYTPGTDCSEGQYFIQGDICLSGELREWYDTTCHAQDADYTYYDCNKLCMEEGLPGGKCVPVADACGRGLDSAVCECDILQ